MKLLNSFTFNLIIAGIMLIIAFAAIIINETYADNTQPDPPPPVHTDTALVNAIDRLTEAVRELGEETHQSNEIIEQRVSEQTLFMQELLEQWGSLTSQ